MNGAEELSRLLSAERAEKRPELAADQGLVDLRHAFSTGVPALGVAHGPLKLGLSALVKWGTGSGLLIAALTASGFALRPNAAVRDVNAIAVASASTRIAPTPLAPPQPPEPVGSTKPAASSPKATGRSASSPEREAPSTFADELRLMKAAKQDLDAGKDHLARVWLAEHARLYPDGVFQSEREALEVLMACRQAPTGREAARRYVAQHPRSPLIDRISRACQLDGEPISPPAANFPDAVEIK
jgi:hypothetical protein